MERLSRGRSQRIASNKEKSFENGSKMPPRRLQKRSKIAPRWLPGGSRAPPESANESGHLFCSFFSPLGRLLGLSWGAPGGSWGCLGASWAAPGPSRGTPGGHFGLPGVSFWGFLGLFFTPAWKIAKTLKNLVFFQLFLMVFASPGGPKSSPNGSEIALARVLATSWRSLGASRRCLGVSWRPLGALGASWAPHGPLLGRF